MGALLVAGLGLVAWGVSLVLPDDGGSAETMRPASASAPADDARATELPSRPPTPEAARAEPLALPAEAGADLLASPVGLEEAPDPSRLTLVLTHAPDLAAVGATVVLARDGDVVDVGTTSVRGVASFDGADAAATVYVGGASHAEARFDLPRARGVHELALPPGRLLSGVVLVDGRPPEEPIGLYLSPRSRRSDAPDRGAVREALETVDSGWDREVGLHTGAGGAFRFGGVDEDWSGWICFPFAYILASGEDFTGFQVPRPDTGLVVRLARRAAVRGRVVDVAGVPAAGAPITYSIAQADGSFGTHHLISGRDGRFAIPLKAYAVEKLTIDVLSADARAAAALQPEEIDPRVGLDLGDIVLEGMQMLALRVQDERGEPIAGAVAHSTEGQRLTSAPTDADGRTVVLGPRELVCALTVSALGYDSATVPLAHPAGAPIQITLVRSPNLEVRVTGPDGEPLHRMSVGVVSERPLFAGGAWSSGERQEKLGAAALRMGTMEDGRVRMRTLTDVDGRVVLTGLVPGGSVDLDVRDPYGTPAGPPRTLTLASGEQRVVEWRVDVAPREVTVLVRDRSGQSVGGASVAINGRDELYPSRSTRSSGLVTFERMLATRGDVSVQAKGHASVWLRDQSLPTDDTPLVVELEPVEPLMVHVVDANGTPVRFADVELLDMGREVSALQLDSGLWRLDTAPPGEVRLSVERGRWTTTHVHDTRTGPAHLVLPATGSLEVGWTVPPEPGRRVWVELRELGPDAFSTTLSAQDELRAVVFDAVPSGRYEAQLFGRSSGTLAVPLTPAVPVSVEAGQTTRLVLTP